MGPIVSNDPLSDDEIARLRLIMQQDERMTWLFASVRFWAAWVLSVLAAIVVFRDTIRELTAWIFRGTP